jgi:hypothetical protein
MEPGELTFHGGVAFGRKSRFGSLTIDRDSETVRLSQSDEELPFVNPVDSARFLLSAMRDNPSNHKCISVMAMK